MDTNHGDDAGSTEPLESWAAPEPGTAIPVAAQPTAVTSPVLTPGSAYPTVPATDPWTSHLWGRPDTVGVHWGAPDPADRIGGPLVTAPAPRRPVSRGLVAGVAALIAAVLIGVGVVKALPTGTDAPVASPPSTSAPANPLPTTPADPGQDPLQGLLPGLNPQGQPSAGSGTPGGTSATADPAVVAAVAPALVNITTAIGYDGNSAAGTGIVLTSDGIVLTNHHVIAGATSIRAAVAGTTRTYQADVLGYDASHDIAVIKLRGASGLTTAPLGDSSTVKVGDAVVGLGNAGGRGGKPIAAAGSVTGLGRSITATDSENGTSEELHDLIETDANIQPGDSGGALASSDGKVIGIITAGSVGPSTTRDGAVRTTDGYAVPINQALAIAQDIRDGKASSTVHIGASAFLGIQVAGSPTGTGIVVSGVIAGSAAEKAGITAGSTITALDGSRVTTNAELRALIAPHHPGDTVSISWTTAAGKSRTADVTLGSGPIA
ncbi:MAG: trypsin-like peptidase domain-containing protein [Actinomycetales bacterium]|nr:trypsin-like peptidase domain-containing protein [Actinomycetales bacterium]